MKRLLVVLVVLLVGVAALGYYRGWFTVSSGGVTVNKENLKEDEEKAKDKLQGLKGQGSAKADDTNKEGTAKATGAVGK